MEQQMNTEDMQEKQLKSTVEALMLILVINQLKLDMPDGENMKELAKALVVKSADNEKKECPELQLAYTVLHGKK